MTKQQESTSTRRVTRTGAAIAAVALTVSACGSGESAESPAATANEESAEPLATEPTATEPPATEPPPTEPDPTTTIAPTEPAAITTGEVRGTCAYDFVEQLDVGAVLDQKCVFDDASESALPDTFEQTFVNYFGVEGAPEPAGGAEVVAGGGDLGFVLAGTLLAGTARLVAVRPGVREFEGSAAHLLALSPQSQDGGFTMTWFVGDEPPFGELADSESAFIEFECTLATDTESCTYSGEDERFVPAPDERTLFTTEADEVSDPIDGVSIFTSGADDGSVRAGLDDDNGLRRFTGIRSGTGELEGSLVEETGWGRRVGDSFTGTIQMSVIEA